MIHKNRNHSDAHKTKTEEHHTHRHNIISSVKSIKKLGAHLREMPLINKIVGK